MQFVDILTEDDEGNQTNSIAWVEFVHNDLYTIRYLCPTKKKDLYKFENKTYDVELESINYFYDGLKDFGFVETPEGWLKTHDSHDSDYSASTEDTDTDESCYSSSEEEESS